MQTHMEQEAEVLLEESSVASRPWANRKVLGVLGVLGLVGTAAVAAMPHKFSSKAALAPEGIIQAQISPPGPYGAQQGYGAQVAHGPVGAPIAEHPTNFIPFAEAQAMSGAAAPPVAVPYGMAAPAAAAPYGMAAPAAAAPAVPCVSISTPPPASTTTGFDCADGLDNWAAGWSIPKKNWCCKNKDLPTCFDKKDENAPYV